MDGGFGFILLRHLYHKLVVAVHSCWLGKRPDTLRAERGVACEYAAAISGRADGNLACRRRGCTAGLQSNFFGWWSRRGAREGRLVGGGCHSRGWAAGEGRIWGENFVCQAGLGRFSNVVRGAGATGRLLPHRSRRKSAG
jgi:hypothetical protein